MTSMSLRSNKTFSCMDFFNRELYEKSLSLNKKGKMKQLSGTYNNGITKTRPIVARIDTNPFFVATVDA